MMEFFLHYITADIKYNFWNEEDGHKFREDWVKCRINIKYFDSPNIQISCYPVNHYETIPLNVDINFADFRFEKALEMNGTKTNVFALLWTQHNQTSEFFIAIDNDTQFKNYESYLNNLVKICRIAENERLDAKIVESSSISYHVSGSSLSLFSTSTYDKEGDKTGSTESISKNENGKRRFGLSCVKNATKCAAKKCNRILIKAKSKFIKPSTLPSSSTKLTNIDDICYETADEFEEVDLNEMSRYSSRSTMFLNDWNRRHTNKGDNDSLNSTLTFNSFDNLGSSHQSINVNSSNSSTSSNSIHQTADLSKICTRDETPIVKSSRVKKVMRKGTPYKSKIPQKLTLYEEGYQSSADEKIGARQEEVASNDNQLCDLCKVDLPVKEPSNKNIVNSEPKLHFIQKESVGKRVLKLLGNIHHEIVIAWKSLLVNIILHSSRVIFSFD